MKLLFPQLIPLLNFLNYYNYIAGFQIILRDKFIPLN